MCGSGAALDLEKSGGRVEVIRFLDERERQGTSCCVADVCPANGSRAKGTR